MDVEIKWEMLLAELKDAVKYESFCLEVEKVKQASGFGKVVAIVGIAADAIKIVEHAALKLGATGVGPAKKVAVVKFIDDLIQLPIWLEFLDGPLISVAVDKLVGLLNWSTVKK